MQRLLRSARVYRAASATAHAARVFAASVFVSLLLFHVNEGVGVIGPLAAGAMMVIVAPAALEAMRQRR
ncbi:MAG TPA: hypothetical protein VEZ14_00115 [Dehalococcoidia bacterium]|nr:hypothetical protein [Dehalococcoidia bacterium]